MQAFVYENHTNEQTNHNFLKLAFNGQDKNKFGVGATVLLYYDDKTVLQEQIPSRGFQSSMDYVMTIGLGEEKVIDSLRVIWPDNRTQKLVNVKVNQTITLEHDMNLTNYRVPKKKAKKSLLREVKNSTLIAHQENAYNDFDQEGLIYSLLSQEGPSLAVGDIDNDGNEDIFIGGAKGASGTIYKHYKNGNLKPIAQNALQIDALYEDTSAAFFDADGDNDLDLIVGSGGNEVRDQASYRCRLYLNNGKGIFTKTFLP